MLAISEFARSFETPVINGFFAVCLLLTAYCSPLTAYCSPLTAHRSPLTAYYLPLTAHFAASGVDNLHSESGLCLCRIWPMRNSLLGAIWAGSTFFVLLISGRTISSSAGSTPPLTPVPADEAPGPVQEPRHGQSEAVKAFRKTALSIEFPSKGLTLRGWIYKPAGDGPFPAILWNHGAERIASACPELALFCTQHGYVFFLPVRHGHNPSPGEYFGDTIEDYIESGADRTSIQQKAISLEEESNEDVVAALNWLKKQSYTNPNAIAVVGTAYGGLQSLLAAEKGLDLRACIAFGPGAISWGNREVRQRTIEAVQHIKIPIFLLQAQNDYSLGPSEVLDSMITERGGANRAKVYLPFGTTHAEGSFGFVCWEEGIRIWGADFLDFLKAAGMGGAGGKQ
jgi:carboxymethylenebutenolidase